MRVRVEGGGQGWRVRVRVEGKGAGAGVPFSRLAKKRSSVSQKSGLTWLGVRVGVRARVRVYGCGYG